MRQLSILGIAPLSVIAAVSLAGCYSRATPSGETRLGSGFDRGDRAEVARAYVVPLLTCSKTLVPHPSRVFHVKCSCMRRRPSLRTSNAQLE